MLEPKNDKMLRKTKKVNTKEINFMFPTGNKPLIIKATNRAEALEKFNNLNKK